MDETLNAQLQQAHAAGVAQTPYQAPQRYMHVPQYNCGGFGCGFQPCNCAPPVTPHEMPWDRTIRELREENARLTGALEQAHRDAWRETSKMLDAFRVHGSCHEPDPALQAHVIWWPDELAIPVFTGPVGARTVQLPESDNPTVGKGVVDNVVDALNRRVVPPPDRTRLRDALDKADAPQVGRAGADEALGRAIRFGGSNAA